MIAGVTNDSMITVVPIFWSLMGIGISMNRIVNKRELMVEKVDSLEFVFFCRKNSLFAGKDMVNVENLL